MREYTDAEWVFNRVTFGIVKAVLFLPILALTFIPAWIYDKMCALCWKLERWWWA